MDPKKPNQESSSGPPPSLLGRSRGRARGIVLQQEGLGLPPPDQPGRPLEARVVNLTLGSHGSGSNGNGNGSGSGNGSGRGQGSVRGGVVAPFQPRPLTNEMFDIIETSFEPKQKKGDQGQAVELRSNYFPTRKALEFSLFHYHVEFSPIEDRTFVKKRIMAPMSGRGPGPIRFGIPFIFDGASMYTTKRLEDRYLELTVEYDGYPVEIKIRLVAELPPGDVLYVNFFNVMVRKCMSILDLTLMGRNFFDPSGRIAIPQHRLELWPGFVTTLREHDYSLIYCVEITHKVLRTDTVWDYIRQTRLDLEPRNGLDYVKEEVLRNLKGTIVMTKYNNKTYKVDGIDWNKKPIDTFPGREGPVTFIEYYQRRHQIPITNTRQPLIVCSSKESDQRRGKLDPILLIPEFCCMTGLTDQMRANFSLMKDLGHYLFQPPQRKFQATIDFVRRLRANPQIQEEFDSWGVEIGPNPLKIDGRQFPKEEILFQTKNPSEPFTKFMVNDQADFTMAFRSNTMISSVALGTWVIILPARDDQSTNNLVATMQRVSRPLGFQISNETERSRLSSTAGPDYAAAIENLYKKYGRKLQMVFCILPTNKLDTYAAIKQKCYVDLGVSSQCFLSKNVTSKGLMSIATKLVVQMNAKLGGVPWQIALPLKKTMIIGFDVYHGGMGSNNPSVGAMVSTTDESFGRFFSRVCMFMARNELATKMPFDVAKCVEAFAKKNGGLFPGRIFLYRDGVGEGQLYQVFHVEVENVKACLVEMYREAGQEPPLLSFIVNTKRINTRFFRITPGGAENPLPGTIVDSAVTIPNRWDFFLVAQQARQGVVSPTNYNVIHDTNMLEANKVQRMTFKLCHLYYNWSGTVAVPALCQYAHKLAYLTGMAMQRESNPALSNLLYFL